MSLLRCPKFPRCLTGDAGNFDRGHSLTSLPLPPAALSSLPTGAMTHRKKYGARPGQRGEGTPPYKRNTDWETSVRTGFAMTHRKKCDTSPAGEQRRPPLRTFSNRMS